MVEKYRVKWESGQVVLGMNVHYEESGEHCLSPTYSFPLVFASSLEGRFEDEELQQILDDIQTKRSFQY